MATRFASRPPHDRPRVSSPRFSAFRFVSFRSVLAWPPRTRDSDLTERASERASERESEREKREKKKRKQNKRVRTRQKKHALSTTAERFSPSQLSGSRGRPSVPAYRGTRRPTFANSNAPTLSNSARSPTLLLLPPMNHRWLSRSDRSIDRLSYRRRIVAIFHLASRRAIYTRTTVITTRI